MSSTNFTPATKITLSIVVEFGEDATENVITSIREDLLERLNRANMSVLRKSASPKVVSDVTTRLEIE